MFFLIFNWDKKIEQFLLIQSGYWFRDIGSFLTAILNRAAYCERRDKGFVSWLFYFTLSRLLFSDMFEKMKIVYSECHVLLSMVDLCQPSLKPSNLSVLGRITVYNKELTRVMEISRLST